MIGSMANAHIIKEAVLNNDTTTKTLEFINKMTEFNEVPMPITRIPLSKVAIAGLHMLGVKKYQGNDDGVLFYINNFKILLEQKHKVTT